MKVWLRLKWNERPSVPWAKGQKMILCCMFFISPSAYSWVQGKSYIMLSTREVNFPAYGGS